MIRDLAPEDLPRMAEVWQAAFNEPVEAKTILILFNSRSHRILVFTEGLVVMGFVVIYLARNAKKFNIDYLARHPLDGGKGIGQALMKEAEQVARLHGATHMRLAVRSNNVRGRKFYNLQGYRPVKDTKIGFTMEKTL